ncbi:ATP-binding cassette domain-containing protein [Candidatus Dependentiae bacterium]|nr:ATP-binding cassette domain-containing protein [Candidatus Dependentiae bacterium]
MNKILLQIKKLKKYYKKNKLITRALDGISLDIYAGEILGLLGVNGAGKTTLSSLLATLHPATSGEILFNGKSIYKNICKYREHIGYCPQKPNLNFNLTVEQNIKFAGSYFGLSKKEIESKTNKLIEEYQLDKYRESNPGDLSGGYKQRVLLARSLIHDPKLIILDEPTVGLDPHIRHQLWETIRNLKKKGVTVILTTHYLDEAEILSDRICLLDKGKIKLIDTPKNLTSAYQKSRLEDVFLQLMHEEAKED